MQNKLSIEWGLNTWRDIEKAKNRIAAVLIPVGSIEQHGEHLPLLTDSLISYNLSLDVARKAMSEKLEVLVLPPLYYGYSPEWSRFSGTITLSKEGFEKVVKDIISNLVRQGIETIIIVNSHGGNTNILSALLRDLAYTSATDLKILSVEWWKLLEAEVRRIMRSEVSHADEAETSLALYYGLTSEELVREVCRDKGSALQREWPKTSIHVSRKPFEPDFPGSFGNPCSASKEKGSEIANLFVLKMLGLIKCLKTNTVDDCIMRLT